MSGNYDVDLSGIEDDLFDLASPTDSNEIDLSGIESELNPAGTQSVVYDVDLSDIELDLVDLDGSNVPTDSTWQAIKKGASNTLPGFKEQAGGLVRLAGEAIGASETVELGKRLAAKRILQSQGQADTPEAITSLIADYESRGRGLLTLNEPISKGLESVSNYLTSQGEEIASNARDERTPINAEDGSLPYYAGAAVESVGNMVPALAAGIATRNTGVATSVMMPQVAGSTYEKARNEGADEEAAQRYAKFSMFAEVIPEKLALDTIFKGGKSLLGKIGAGVAAEGAQEAFTEVINIGLDMGILDQEMTWKEAYKRIKDAGIIGGMVGGTIAAPAKLAEHRMNNENSPDPDQSTPKLDDMYPVDVTDDPAFLPDIENMQPVDVISNEAEFVNQDLNSFEPLDITESDLSPVTENLPDIDSMAPIDVIANEADSLGQSISSHNEPEYVSPDVNKVYSSDDAMLQAEVDAAYEQVQADVSLPSEVQLETDAAGTGIPLNAIASNRNLNEKTEQFRQRIDHERTRKQAERLEVFIEQEKKDKLNAESEAVNAEIEKLNTQSPANSSMHDALVKAGFKPLPEELAKAEYARTQPRINYDQIDTRKDDVLTAIAKLGGLSRVEAKSQGVDPAHFNDRRGFGRPVFRKEGGMSFDQAAELLSQNGYTPADYTANDLLDRVSKGLSGEFIGTAEGYEYHSELQAKRAEVDRVLMEEDYQAASQVTSLDGAEPVASHILADSIIEAIDAGVPLDVINAKLGDLDSEVDAIVPVNVLRNLVQEAANNGYDSNSPGSSQSGSEKSTKPGNQRPASSQQRSEPEDSIDTQLEEILSGKSGEIDSVEPDIFSNSANQAATSPHNDLPEPTQAQKEAGNYKVGKIKVAGLDISIENPKDSIRSGTSPDGTNWENRMGAHYGYIRQTLGADGDHVDVFVGDKPESKKVWVIDQVNKDGSFDEHKVLIGFDNRVKAVKAYKDSYDKGWKVGPITPMSLDEFKAWVKGDTKSPLHSPPDLKLKATAKAPSTEGVSVSGPKKNREVVYPIGTVEAAYTHTSNNPKRAARSHQESFDRAVDRQLKKAEPHAETPQQRKTLERELDSFKQDYIAEEAKQLGLRSNTVSRHVAGSSKFNDKQAARRNAPLDQSISDFDSWLKTNEERVLNAVLSARSPEQTQRDTESENKQRKQSELNKQLKEIGSNLASMMDPGMDKALLRPGATKALKSALGLDRDKTIEALKKIDEKHVGSGGLGAIVGTRSQFWREYQMAINTQDTSSIKNQAEVTADTQSVRFSRGRAENPHTVSSLRKEMNAIFPGVISALASSNSISIVSKLPEGQPSDVRAFVASGKVTFVASNIDINDNVKGLMLHEIGVHVQRLGRSKDDFQQILKQFKNLKKINNRKVVKAFNSVPSDTPTNLVSEEALGYFVEQNPDLSLAQRVLTWIREQLRKLGKTAKGLDRIKIVKWANELTADDVVYMATSSTRNVSTTEQGAHTDDVLYSRNSNQRSAISDIADRVLAQPDSDRTIRQRVSDYWKSHKERWKVKLKQGLVDHFASIEELEKQVYDSLVDASESAYKAAAMSKNSNTVLEVAMHNGSIKYHDGGIEIIEDSKGLMEILEPLAEQNLVREWELWAGAKRAKRLLQEGKEKLFTEEDIAAIEQHVTGDKLDMFDRIHSEWIEFNKRTLDFAESAGLIDPEARALWEHDDYVPFHRVSELGEEQSGPNTKGGLSGQKSGIQTLTGGIEKISIVESMVRNTAHMIEASMKNVAMQRTIILAEQTGAVEKVRDASISEAEARSRLNQAGIEYKDDHLPIWQKMLEKHDARHGTVTVSKNGKAHRFIVNDPLLLRSLTTLGPTGVEGIMKILRIPKRVLTELITADPAFALRNLIRDTLSTWVTVHGVKRNPIADAINGVVASYKGSETQDAMRAMGVGGGGFYDTSPDGARAHLNRLSGNGKIINKAGDLWKAGRKILGTTENANRIAIYENALKGGASKAEAAYQSLDVLNFTRHGDYKIIRILIELVPFMNARIQGLDKLLRGAKEGTEAWHQFNKSFMLKGMILTGATLALLAANWENEEYWDLPEWERDTYYHFWIEGEHYRLPKPFEVGSIFSTVPERLFEQFRADANMKLLGSRMLHMLKDTLALDPTPQFLKPIAEIGVNESSFTGRKIVTEGMKFVSPEAQYTPYTSKTFIELADSMPDSAPEWMRSPVKLEHLYRGYFGTLGSYIMMVSDKAVALATDAPDRPAVRLQDIPVAGSFIRDGVNTNKHVGRVYDMSANVNKLHAEIKKYSNEGRKQKAKSIYHQGKERLKTRVEINKAVREMSSISSEMRRIYDNKVMLPEAKRRKLDHLIKRRNKIAKVISNRYWQQYY